MTESVQIFQVRRLAAGAYLVPTFARHTRDLGRDERSWSTIV